MDIANYAAMKAKGLVMTYRLGNTYVVVEKKFNPDTGEALTDQVSPLDLAALREAREKRKQELGCLDEIITDLEGMAAMQPKDLERVSAIRP